MSRLPIPPTAPSAQAARILRSIRDLTEKAPETDEGYTQRVVDLLHIHRAAIDPLDPCIYEAVRGRKVQTFPGMAEATGISKSSVQQRVDAADPTKPGRGERWNARQRAKRDAESEGQ